MVPLVDEAQVEARFGPIEHSANLDARLVHGSPLTYHRLRNRFGRTRQYSKVMRIKWKLDSVCLAIVLILMQDRCLVCAERTIGLKVIFYAPDGNS